MYLAIHGNFLGAARDMGGGKCSALGMNGNAVTSKCSKACFGQRGNTLCI